MENLRENKISSVNNMMSPDRRVLGDIQNKFSSDTLSPTTNLKLLTEVASDLEKRRNSTEPLRGKACEKYGNKDALKNNTVRKFKSLTLLCEKFLQIYPLNVPANENMVISLDSVAEVLGTERRRLYDIINMLECLQMARKVAKNSYRWFGCQKLHVTLAHLKILAIKLGLQQQVWDIQSRNKFKEVDGCNDFSESHPVKNVKNVQKGIKPSVSENCGTDRPVVQFIITNEEEDGDDSVTTLNVDIVKKQFDPILVPSVATDSSKTGMPYPVVSEFSEILPKIKSLGMLCQSFLMIFLVADKSYPITLDNISRILGLPASSEGDPDGASSMADTCQKDSAISYKTKVRRLYDIANVLSSLHIICKIKRYELLTKKPLFKYTGPPVKVVEVSLSEKINFSNSTRHSLLGNELLDASENETTLELKLQPGNHPQWVVSKLSVDKNALHNRRLLNVTSETTPKLLRTKSNDMLCRKKKIGDSRLENTKCSLDGILNIAEMELRRLQSIENESLWSVSPEKRKRDSRDEQPTAARRRLFSRHYSEPCIHTHQGASTSLALEPHKSAESHSDQNTNDEVPSGNSVSFAAGEVTKVVTIDECNTAATAACSEFRGGQLDQRQNKSEKQHAIVSMHSGQKLKIVRRFEKLLGDPVAPKSVFLKTYTCRPVKVLSLNSSMVLPKCAEPKSADDTASCLATLETTHQEQIEKTRKVACNFSRAVMLKGIDYSKLPKLKLVKIGNLTKLVPLYSGDGKPTQ